MRKRFVAIALLVAVLLSMIACCADDQHAGNRKQKCRWNHQARRRADTFFTRDRRRFVLCPLPGLR